MAFFYKKHFLYFVTPHGVKITRWMIKYPGIKKNAASTITQQCPDPQYTSKATYTQCTSFLKNLHSSKNAHSILS